VDEPAEASRVAGAAGLLDVGGDVGATDAVAVACAIGGLLADGVGEVTLRSLGDGDPSLGARLSARRRSHPSPTKLTAARPIVDSLCIARC
jgi:hypothetical protein